MTVKYPALTAAFALVLAGCASWDTRSETVKSENVGPTSMSQSQVEQLLMQHGYTQVTNLHKNGNDWVGSGTSDKGDPVSFDIDQNGIIRSK